MCFIFILHAIFSTKKKCIKRIQNFSVGNAIDMTVTLLHVPLLLGLRLPRYCGNKESGKSFEQWPTYEKGQCVLLFASKMPRNSVVEFCFVNILFQKELSEIRAPATNVNRKIKFEGEPKKPPM